MENSRLLLATFLSALVLLVWGVYFRSQPPVEESPSRGPADSLSTEDGRSADDAGARSEGSGGDARADAAEGDGTTSVESDDTATEDEAPTTAATRLGFESDTVQAERQEIVRVETDRAFVEFDNRGAQLVSYRLKNQLDGAGNPLDLVRARGSDLYPFALLFGGGGSKLNTVLWQSELTTNDEGLPTLRFRHASEAGAGEKTFFFDEMGFMDVAVRLDRGGDWGVLLGPGVGDEEGKTYGQTVDRAVGFRRGSESDTIDAKKLKEDQFFAAREIDWISLEDNFFLVAAVPMEGMVEARVFPILERDEVVEGKPRFLPADTSSSEDDLTKEQAIVLLAGGSSMEVRTYFGSKRYSYLSDLPYHLEESVRWGALGVLSKPLYIVLRYLHDHVVPNYGWTIVLTTLLIRLVFFPLTHRGQKSMTKMQELNPKIQSIRAKYRPKLKDKQGRPNLEAQRQMNEEVMAVYKSAGVNPASGCFPVLLQMPVFFAFYRLLTAAVELRAAEWILWIDDLSVPDPYWILPLLMGGTSVLMQRMQPKPADPMQRRLMQFMPIGFTAFAFAFPSGLVLYWLTNNLVSMLQQRIINGPKKDAEVALVDGKGRRPAAAAG